MAYGQGEKGPIFPKRSFKIATWADGGIDDPWKFDPDSGSTDTSRNLGFPGPGGERWRALHNGALFGIATAG